MLRTVVVCLTCLLGPHAFASTNEEEDFNRFLVGVGLPSAQTAAPLPARLVSAAQDFGTLTVNLSCHTRTPLRIGETTYKEGLGSHANGRIVFQIESPMATFAADVGIDNNDDTARGRDKASAAFVVKGDDRELARTPICRYGHPPQHIEVSLANVRQLELIVTDAGDGISYDQADWGDARLIDANGKILQLSAIVATARPSFLRPAAPPASFVYGGQSSVELLKSWTRTLKPPVETPHSRIHEMTWLESPEGLAATWRADVFKDRHAVEFRWFFENRGKTPVKPLTNVYALDLQLAEANAVQLIHSTGGLTGPFVPLGEAPAFLISESNLASPITMAAVGGRSSVKDLPFFQVHHGSAQSGLFVGIGWSGQWQADFRPDAAGGTRVTIEMPNMNLALPAGEKICSPSVLLGLYQGDSLAGSNALRRILYDHYVALLDSKKPLAPVSWNHWFTFENAVSEDMLKRQADAAADLGLEYFCIDSGWFDGGFPGGVGNWTLDRAKFPKGLGPIGKYVADKGMKLGLWFEPARAEPGTRLCREHSDWVDGNRVKFELPEVCEWVYQMMCGFIDEGHVRWIRYDYNFDPLAGWDRTDKPETRGLTQIRYFQGEYGLFDRLRAKYPDLLIESCSSGGRRIDLETMRRAHTYWKSDETSNLNAARSQETGGNRFLPAVLLNTNLPATYAATRFDLHSLFGGPLGFASDWTKLDAAARDRVRQEIIAFKTVRHLLDKDYYPLFQQTFDLTQWVGWEFNDPGAGEGFLVVLRPQESPYASVEVRLSGVEADKKYRLSRVDGGYLRDVTGQDLLTGLAIPLRRGESEVLRFQRQ